MEGKLDASGKEERIRGQERMKKVQKGRNPALLVIQNSIDLRHNLKESPTTLLPRRFSFACQSLSVETSVNAALYKLRTNYST